MITWTQGATQMSEIIVDHEMLWARTNIKGIQVGAVGVEGRIVKIGELLCDCVNVSHDG